MLITSSSRGPPASEVYLAMFALNKQLDRFCGSAVAGEGGKRSGSFDAKAKTKHKTKQQTTNTKGSLDPFKSVI